MTPSRGTLALGAALALAGCGGTLDAGRDKPHGLLPVDERNPVILSNDGESDNWGAEYAALLANSGGPPLIGNIIAASKYWPDLNGNARRWNDFLTTARRSGLNNLPDLTPSPSSPLVRPDDGEIDSTTPNNSPGAALIVDLSRQFATPNRPVVVASATRLTDLADAYLMDHSVVDRVVIVAALGTYAEPKATMDGPNGDLDPWSSWIVAQRYRYVEVCTYYDQLGDVTVDDLGSLPANPLGERMAAKQSDLFDVATASDQVAILAVGLPGFVTGVQLSSPDISTGFDPARGPPLLPDVNGSAWVVTQLAPPLAASRLWQMLLDPHTFGM